MVTAIPFLIYTQDFTAFERAFFYINFGFV